MDASDDQQGIPIDQVWSALAAGINAGLLQEHGTLPDGAPKYQFEFVESQDVNAFAAEYAGVRMICVTVPLRTILLEHSFALSCSEPISRRFTASTVEQQQVLHMELLGIVLGFVASHEEGHHRFNHRVSATMKGPFFNDVVSGLDGSIEDQGQELHADGWAAYLVIHGLLIGDRRPFFTTTLGEQATDELLLCLAIIGIATFLFTRPPTTFDPSTVETLTHPPAAFRLEFIMRHIQRWCRETRPNLLPFLTLQRFQELLGNVRDTLWQGRGLAWPEQQLFAQSPEGIAYGQKLAAAYDSLQAGNRVRDSKAGNS